MVVLGRLVAPYGVKGWLRLHPFGDDPASWKRISPWYLSPSDAAETWRSLELDAIKMHSSGWVVKFLGVEDRSGAEALIGSFVGAPKDSLPQNADGEYYWADLIGLSVVNQESVQFGTVVSLIETGANDVLVVRDSETERLIPYIESVVLKVDLAVGQVTVDWGQDW